MNNPVISVLMSVYNTKESYLREAVESILSQTFKEYEFIIINDNSNRETSEILNSYLSDSRIIIVNNQENIGLTKNLNYAISISKGEYLARMDADDVAMPDRFKKQITFLRTHQEISAVGTYYTILENEKEYVRSKEVCDPKWIKARLFFCNAGLMHSSMMMRASVVNSNDGLLYDERVKKSQDFDLWVRMSRNHLITVIPTFLMKYRVSSSQISNANRREQTSFREQILIKEVKEFGIEPSDKNLQLHLKMCDGEEVVSIRDLVEWTNKLIETNRNNKLYDNCAFEYYLSLFSLRSAKRSCKKVLDYPLLLNFCCRFLYMTIKKRFVV